MSTNIMNNYCNDPYVMMEMDNMTSINNCLEVDLFGQIASESSGFRQISGTGGQLNFLTCTASIKHSARDFFQIYGFVPHLNSLGDINKYRQDADGGEYFS